MAPGGRKALLTVHLVTSLGWLGAVAAFVSLAVAGLRLSDTGLGLAAYPAMKWVTWWVIVPLAFASLASGVSASLGTQWGLVRFYWIAVKLLATAIATIVLVLHTRPVDELAEAARATASFTPHLHGTQVFLIVVSAGALTLLVGLTAISVFKPRGLTPYGWRKQAR